METLAYTHIAVDYEELNSCSELRAFSQIKSQALKAVKSIALAAGGITTCIANGGTSLASKNMIRNTTANYEPRIVALHPGTGEKDTTGYVSNPPIVPHTAAPYGQQNQHHLNETPSKLVVGVNTNQMQSTTPGKERYGKLTLVNDTPTPKLIYLIPPTSAIPKRYAYVTGCTVRQLTNEYSTGWRYTTDMLNTAEIKKEATDRRLLARASLLKNSGGVSCTARHEIEEIIRASQTAKPINADPRKSVSPNAYTPVEANASQVDKYIHDITEIAIDCSQPNEVIIRCLGLYHNGYLTPLKNGMVGEYVGNEYDIRLNCDSTCKPEELNKFLTLLLDRVNWRMGEELKSTLQSLATNAPAQATEYNRRRQKLVDAMITEASTTDIEKEFKGMNDWLFSYLTQAPCPGQRRYNTVSQLYNEWYTIWRTNIALRNALKPMAITEIAGQVPYNQPPRALPTLGIYLDSTRCWIFDRTTTHQHMVVSYKPGMQ